MFEQTFKNIDDVLWKEAGCTTELDYTEQTSWLLFLKYLDDLEQERSLEAELAGKPYEFILDPVHLGDRVYDGACGSAGFLCETYDYLRQGNLTTRQLEQLQTETFTGKEKKSLAYVIAIMNMILHGIDAPNIIHTNTLSENLSDIQEKNRFDVILANPPFGGKERKEVQQNFPIKTGETAFLFLQHFIKILKVGGRAAVVIKNTFLSNSDNASKALRQELLESCNLHTILDCPSGTFIGAGVKTVVLFFEKGVPFDSAQGTPLFAQGKPLHHGMATRKIWYYQLDPGRNMGKTNSLNDEDLREFVELQASCAESEHFDSAQCKNAWLVDVADIDRESFDLSVKNPNKAEEAPLRSPQEILESIAALDAESAEILAGIGGML